LLQLASTPSSSPWRALLRPSFGLLIAWRSGPRSALSFARRVLLLPHVRARRPAETRATSPSCPPWLLPLRGKRGLPLSLDARRSGHGRPAPRLSAPRRPGRPYISLAQEILKCRRLGLPWPPASPLQPSSLTSPAMEPNSISPSPCVRALLEKEDDSLSQ
jgi:hypothetical protein